MFEEDYTEEDLEKLAERRKNQTQHRQRRKDQLRKTDPKRLAWLKQYREKNIEKMREYNAAVKRRMYKIKKPVKSHEAQVRAGIKESLQRAKRHNPRGRMTQTRLFELFGELEQLSIKTYIEKNMNGNRKHIILCIVGPSGAGKTLASLHLENKFGANTICSFTTRPPRPTEEEGRDHHFVDIVPAEDELLAYTIYGGYKYYALKTQVQGPVTVYVIDEKGLLELKEKFSDIYDVRAIHIDRKPIYRRVAGVSDKRMERDNQRAKTIPIKEYDHAVINNGTKVEFFRQIDKIYTDLLEEAKKYGW